MNFVIILSWLINQKRYLINFPFTFFCTNYIKEEMDAVEFLNKSKKILSGKINDIKSAYKSDIYKIKHLNKIDDKISNFSVIDSKIVFDNIYESEIKLTKKISSNDLLRLLLSNSIEILEFKQKTPNMNDIFIMKVEEGNNNG